MNIRKLLIHATNVSHRIDSNVTVSKINLFSSVLSFRRHETSLSLSSIERHSVDFQTELESFLKDPFTSAGKASNP